MNLGDLNFLFIVFYLLLFTLLINNNYTLYLLLTAELLWVLLYTLSAFISFLYNDLNLLSLTLFFLVFSAVELAVGLVLMIFQNFFMRSLYLTDLSNNSFNFNKRLTKRFFFNKINFNVIN